MEMPEEIDLSIVMPCLNEENTVGLCITDALNFINKYNINGEVIVVDNASIDGSQAVARANGAKVIYEDRRGYGNAIRTGIKESRGRVIIIGDCDTTYDFLNLEKLYEPLISGQCDMVIGNRYEGGIQKGGMPLSHWLGVKALSLIARIRFHTDVYDFHCGLRGISKDAAGRLEFKTTGMEFATEMIAVAAREDLRIVQVPVVLRKCVYNRSSKLNTISDGFRHLRYIIKRRSI